jgi:hypothetical protein
LISTTRGSGLVVVIGLAHQVMLPLAALPLALEVAAAPGALAEVDGEELLLQAAAVNAATAQTAAACKDRRLRPV